MFELSLGSVALSVEDVRASVSMPKSSKHLIAHGAFGFGVPSFDFRLAPFFQAYIARDVPTRSLGRILSGTQADDTFLCVAIQRRGAFFLGLWRSHSLS